MTAGFQVIRGRLPEAWEGLPCDFTFPVIFAGSLSSLKQESGLYRDKQLDAAIAWYLSFGEEWEMCTKRWKAKANWL